MLEWMQTQLAKYGMLGVIMLVFFVVYLRKEKSTTTTTTALLDNVINTNRKEVEELSQDIRDLSKDIVDISMLEETRMIKEIDRVVGIVSNMENSLDKHASYEELLLKDLVKELLLLKESTIDVISQVYDLYTDKDYIPSRVFYDYCLRIVNSELAYMSIDLLEMFDFSRVKYFGHNFTMIGRTIKMQLERREHNILALIDGIFFEKTQKKLYMDHVKIQFQKCILDIDNVFIEVKNPYEMDQEIFEPIKYSIKNRILLLADRITSIKTGHI